MSVEVLGVCDYQNCSNNAVVETGEIIEKETGKSRIGRWCEEHCPKQPYGRGYR